MKSFTSPWQVHGEHGLEALSLLLIPYTQSTFLHKTHSGAMCAQCNPRLRTSGQQVTHSKQTNKKADLIRIFSFQANSVHRVPVSKWCLGSSFSPHTALCYSGASIPQVKQVPEVQLLPWGLQRDTMCSNTHNPHSCWTATGGKTWLSKEYC